MGTSVEKCAFLRHMICGRRLRTEGRVSVIKTLLFCVVNFKESLKFRSAIIIN